MNFIVKRMSSCRKQSTQVVLECYQQANALIQSFVRD